MQKFAFSEHKILIFSIDFAFSESRILGGLLRAVFECKIGIF